MGPMGPMGGVYPHPQQDIPGLYPGFFPPLPNGAMSPFHNPYFPPPQPPLASPQPGGQGGGGGRAPIASPVHLYSMFSPQSPHTPPPAIPSPTPSQVHHTPQPPQLP